jgi:hypothetical protein
MTQNGEEWETFIDIFFSNRIQDTHKNRAYLSVFSPIDSPCQNHYTALTFI